MAYKRKLYEPGASAPFKISRSKLDVFTECQRCSYLDLRLGVRKPGMPSFTLNNAVDELYKREFDTHREAGTKHPVMEEYKLDVVPFNDDRMDEWRDALRRGIMTHHKPSNFILRGGIDDVWVSPENELFVVDYKATSKLVGPSSVDDLYDAYKKQMEIYQWLFRQNGFIVSPIGYFVYANGLKEEGREKFDKRLDFEENLIAYEGDDSWIPAKLEEMRDVLSGEKIPPVGTSFGGVPCEHCIYRESAGKALMAAHSKTAPKKEAKETKTKKDDKKVKSQSESLFD